MIVFLDLDGVLVDFVGGINKAFKLTPSSRPNEKGGTVWNWYRDYGITDEEFNEVCTEEFWHNLNWMQDGQRILSLLEQRIPKGVIYLLTVPMPNKGSWTGKYLWIKDNMPEYTERLIVSSAPKKLFAPGNLLVDDKDSNIDEFILSGGKAILVPRPWNRRGLTYTPVDHVGKQLNKLGF